MIRTKSKLKRSAATKKMVRTKSACKEYIVTVWGCNYFSFVTTSHYSVERYFHSKKRALRLWAQLHTSYFGNFQVKKINGDTTRIIKK